MANDGGIERSWQGNGQRFVRFAKEIIALIESPRTEHWWEDAEDLTWALEEIRREIPGLFDVRSADVRARLKDLWDFIPEGIPLTPSPVPRATREEWPTLLIVTRTAGEKLFGVTGSFLPPLDETDSGLRTVVSMLYGDPFMRVARGSMILHHGYSDGAQR